ncbi:MAG: DUF58 domain-containing protein [Bifidobacteriaceae bacterium]|jgi:uncharacterized protein (DUF58 family)|nr:DUF58 domain-containing protein [Bifidobacteriaceae bacterium]
MTNRAGRIRAVEALLELHSQRRARSMLDGGYASIFPGRGTDFEDLREYVPGDAMADIDWKATARAGRPLVRRYVAERKNNVLLVVSTGRSMTAVAPDGTPKHELALDVAAVFAHLAVRHRDLLGAVYGDTAWQGAVRAAGSRKHSEFVLSRIALASREADGAASDLAAVLDYAVKTRSKHGIAILITDDAELGAAGEKSLAELHARHQVLVVRIADMHMAEGWAESPFDVETGWGLPDEVRLHSALATEARVASDTRAQAIERALARRGIVHGRVRGQSELVDVLIRLLERHRHAGT